jgi:hypothetical protein
MALRGLPLLARTPGNIQVAFDRRALRQAQKSLERLWWASGLEKAHGKRLAQHGRRQTTILKTSPCTEPLKELREHIFGQSCPLLREKQGVRRSTFSRPQAILLQIHGQCLLHLGRQWKRTSFGAFPLNMQGALSQILTITQICGNLKDDYLTDCAKACS